jgi:hypothetical protein
MARLLGRNPRLLRIDARFISGQVDFRCAALDCRTFIRSELEVQNMTFKCALKWIFLAITILPFRLAAIAGGTNSRYSQLTSDVKVTEGSVVPLLSATIHVVSPTWIYVQSDGRYFPNGAALASADIRIDGQKASNDGVIDWRQSVARRQHSFNVIGAQYVLTGDHTIVLEASTVGAPTFFGAGTNLCVLTNAAASLTNSALSSDSQVFDLDTDHTPEGTALPPAGRFTLISSSAGNAANTPVVAVASGRNYVRDSYYGDALWGIFLNGTEPNIDSMAWSINDLFTGSETQAPMFSHALFLSPPLRSTIQLVVSEAPYGPSRPAGNEVQYNVGASSRTHNTHRWYDRVWQGTRSQLSLRI